MGALWHEQAHRQTDSHTIYIKHFNFSKLSGKIKGLLKISKTVFSYSMNIIDSGNFGFVGLSPSVYYKFSLVFTSVADVGYISQLKLLCFSP